MLIRRIKCKLAHLFVAAEIRQNDIAWISENQSGYKVIIAGNLNHPYNRWFRTRQAAREYKRLLRQDPGFKEVCIIRQIVTEEGYILGEKKIF